MRITTWNINSVRTRIQRALDLLHTHDIDVLCLQETKVKDDKFPREAFEDAGYHVTCHGLNQWNGVAIISKEDRKRAVLNNIKEKAVTSYDKKILKCLQ